MAALESGGDAGAKRMRADEEGNQGDAAAAAAAEEVALESDDCAGAKRLRAGEEADPGDAAAAAWNATEDLISELVEDLKLRILALLPLKSAIRTTVLSRGWRGLWELRWPYPSSLRYHLIARAVPSPQKLLESLESLGERRLDRFSLIVETSMMTPRGFRSCLQCASRCGVEDLHVELRRPARTKLMFHFPSSSPLLARLSLRSISVSGMHYKGAQPFSFLEVISLYRVRINDRVLRKMVALCPCLRVLDLRFCDMLDNLNMVLARLNLRRLTVAECDGVNMLNVTPMSSLRSFRYSGSFLSSFYLPRDTPFTDLYICYDDIPRRHAWSDNTVSFNEWYDNTLSNTSELTALTICSNTLQMVSFLADAGANAELAKVPNFQMLTELQLLMFEMKAANLANIYAFLKNCPCPKLERLFVQLPTIRYAYPSVELLNDVDVVEEPPEVGLEKLKVVKVMNFNWKHIEVHLLSFLLRKASSLHTLLLVSPNLVPLNVPSIQQADHLLFKEAVENGQIILSKSDDAATKPFHSEVFAKPFRSDV